jgi:hypothetical protein
VKKEFFQLLVAELLSPDYGMLVYQPESHTYWFNACSLVGGHGWPKGRAENGPPQLVRREQLGSFQARQ